tara:strand:- start:214 stop:639 length:426 start_codon:yes stop_codon:yes gene_type:complete
MSNQRKKPLPPMKPQAQVQMPVTQAEQLLQALLMSQPVPSKPQVADDSALRPQPVLPSKPVAQAIPSKPVAQIDYNKIPQMTVPAKPSPEIDFLTRTPEMPVRQMPVMQPSSILNQGIMSLLLRELIQNNYSFLPQKNEFS